MPDSSVLSKLEVDCSSSSSSSSTSSRPSLSTPYSIRYFDHSTRPPTLTRFALVFFPNSNTQQGSSASLKSKSNYLRWDNAHAWEDRTWMRIRIYTDTDWDRILLLAITLSFNDLNSTRRSFAASYCTSHLSLAPPAALLLSYISPLK